MRSPKLLVVGSIAMDLTVSTRRFPHSGETVTGNTFTTAPGGKGANQAVQAARLGAEVTMVGKVGTDDFGDRLLTSLEEAGIHTEHMSRGSGATGVATILLEQTERDTANRIIVVPGTNGQLCPADVAFLEEGIADYDMVLLQLEIPMEVNLTVARYAQAKGVPVMLNTAPYAPLPEELTGLLSYISPNEHEAALMVGFTVEDEMDACRAVKVLHGQGIQNVIITMGSRGAVFGDGEDCFVSPCVPGVKVADPTAAGDSFVGAFCVAICRGMDHRRAMAFANHTAAITVSRQGAQPSLPTMTEVLVQMEQRDS